MVEDILSPKLSWLSPACVCARRFAYVPNYTSYVATVGDVALLAEVVSETAVPVLFCFSGGGMNCVSYIWHMRVPLLVCFVFFP